MRKTNINNEHLEIIIVGLIIIIVSTLIAISVIRVKELEVNSVLSDYELEGSCNTGFIGIDFQSKYNDTKFLPDKFNLKNIDGMNCNFKIKGNVPILLFINRLDDMLDKLEK